MDSDDLYLYKGLRQNKKRIDYRELRLQLTSKIKERATYIRKHSLFDLSSNPMSLTVIN